MGYAPGTARNMRLLALILLFPGFFQGADTRMQDPVITDESASVQLKVLIPNNDLANSASYITIRHDPENGLNHSDVVFLMKDVPRIKDIYRDRLSVTQIGPNVQLLLRTVSAADAGTYKCFSSSSMAVIPDCGQLLIVVRKPNPPTVKVLPSSGVLVGSDLHLVCETHSISLPPSHRLIPEILWYDHNGQNIDPSDRNRRIHVNRESELVIGSLRREDKLLKFYCTSADNAGGVVTRIMSDPSDIFAVTPEYKPTVEDFRLTPIFESDDIVKKVIGQHVSYQCDADCKPQCDIVWLYKPYGGGVAGIGEVTNLVDKKVLSVYMSRINEGLYRCKAENKYGVINKTFYLETLYMTSPKTFINGQEGTHKKLLEDTPVDLSCVFDSNPGPLVTWRSPSRGVLWTQEATGPHESLASNGIYQRMYTSDQSLTHLKCEDSGVYKCDGRNNVTAGVGEVRLMVICAPSSAGIPGLELLSEYVWDIPHALVISFVIRAMPEPDITRIFSSIRGQPRKEEIPRDFVISKSKMYDQKPHFTKFTLSSRRDLDLRDDGRILTVTIESSEFTKDFLFTIRPRGIPRRVVNLTAWDVDHDSLMLSWTPGFSGGEVQTFVVELRDKNALRDDDDTSQQLVQVGGWTLFMNDIPDPQAGKLVTIQVSSLKSSTSYVVKVTAVNRLGSTATEIEVATLGAPDESLGAGAIVGIILLTLVIVAVIVVIIYCIVYRRRQQSQYASDDDETETQKSMLPKPISTLLTWKTCGSTQEADESVDSAVSQPQGTTSHPKDASAQPQGATSHPKDASARPKKNPWQRLKNLILRENTYSDSEEATTSPGDVTDVDDVRDIVDIEATPSTSKPAAENNEKHVTFQETAETDVL